MQKYGKKLTLDIGNQISLKKINENESAARQKRGNIMIHPSYVELMKVVNNNGGYLNFMGNEFGHPEWIDFPREGETD